MTPADESDLASLLRWHRNAHGLTQEELAELAGISTRAVSDIERGLRRLIYRDTARRLTAVLGLGPEDSATFETAARGRHGGHEVNDTAPGVLPVPLTRLIGRERELATVGDLLVASDARVITLVGPGGVGKTRLALELCRAVGDAFVDGVCFVPLGDIGEGRLVPRAIASALKVRDASERLAWAISANLRDKHLLLVLDTLEHVLDAAPAIAEMVGLAPSVRLLVTSRSPLKIRGERQITVNPLSPAAAIALFTERAEAVGGIQLDDLARPAVAEICARLEGVPLAIELAATRVRHLPPSEILSHLKRRLSILDGGLVDLPARQRTMAATVTWSYDLLGSAERRLLETLSVFAGGWTLESAAAVCPEEAAGGDLIQTLSSLVDFSLVLRDYGKASASRYRMLDVVREYAGDRLRERVKQPGFHELGHRHARHLLAIAEEAEPDLRGSGHRVAVQRLSSELDNLRAALIWTLASGDVAMALRLTGALWMFWRTVGAFSEGRAWLDEALSMVPAGHPEERARALWGAGWLAYQQGDFAATAARGTELLEWSRSASDLIGMRNGVTLLGQERLAESDYSSATGYFDEALQIARKLDSSGWMTATSLLNRSVAAIHSGEPAQARAMLDEAREIYERLGDDRFVARVMLQLSYLALLEGELSDARDLTVAALEAVAALGDRWSVAEQLDGLTAILAAAGDWEHAAHLAGAAESLWGSIGARPHPADRASTERWLIPALEGAGAGKGEAAVAKGRALAMSAAISYALDASEGLELRPRGKPG
jgi:predicted ATPase/transcriptional regulator with XRE-family HTH domain